MFLLAVEYDLDELIAKFGIDELNLDIDLVKKLAPQVCTQYPQVCNIFISLIAGWYDDNYDKSRQDVFLRFAPSGISTMQLAHYAQSIRNYDVRKFDYGYLKNLLKYFSLSPPKYEPKKSVAAPTYFFYGERDILGTILDTNLLLREYPLTAQKGIFLNKKFDHLTYVWGNNTYKSCYKDIVTILKKPGLKVEEYGKEFESIKMETPERDQESGGDNTGMPIAAYIGIGVGAAALIGLTLLATIQYRKRQLRLKGEVVPSNTQTGHNKGKTVADYTVYPSNAV